MGQNYEEVRDSADILIVGGGIAGLTAAVAAKEKNPDEIFEFCDRFRGQDKHTPLVVVPTTYNSVTEEELQKHGVNIVIYANHLIRAEFPAMQKVAVSILKNHRSLETDSDCMPIKEIITLIPE